MIGISVWLTSYALGFNLLLKLIPILSTDESGYTKVLDISSLSENC